MFFKKLKFRRAAALFTLFILLTPNVHGANEQLAITFEKKLALESMYHDIISRQIERFLPETRYLIDLNIIFNEDSIKRYNSRMKKLRRDGLQKIEGQFQQRLDKMNVTLFKATGVKTARLGKLNLELDLAEEKLRNPDDFIHSDQLFSDLLKIKSQIIDIEKNDGQMSASDFIKQVVVQVTLEKNIPSSTVKILKRSIRKVLHLDSVKRKDVLELTSKEVLPREQITEDEIAEAEHKAFMARLLPAVSPGIVIFTGFLILTLGIVFVSMTGIRQVAKASANRANEGGGVPEADASFDTSEDHLKKKEEVLKGRANLARESVEQLRIKVKSLFKENKAQAVEVIRDISFSENGLENIRALIDFLGFSMIEEYLMGLPETEVERIKNYLDLTAGKMVDPDDVSTAITALYQGGISKILGDKVSASSFAPERDLIAMFDDESLIYAFAHLEAEITGTIIPLLSQKHVAHIIAELDKGLVVAMLSKTLKIERLDVDDVRSAVDSLRRAVVQFVEMSDRGTLNTDKIILALMRELDLDNESKVIEALPADRYALKRQIRKINYPVSDLLYFPLDLLKSTLDQMAITARAELIFLTSDDIGQRMLGAYSGSQKISDMLFFELEGIKNSVSKQRKLRRDKFEILARFMKKITSFVNDSPDILILVDQEEYEIKDVAIPAALAAEIESMKTPNPTDAAVVEPEKISEQVA